LYLLDTNVVSELRRPRPHGAVLAWIADVPADRLLLSAVTVGEIQAGIEITREQDRRKAEALETWLDEIVATFSVLPMDAAVFREWARLKYRKSDSLLEDAMIAATAIVHGLTVATRNVRDFESFGVLLLNPFDAR
jgi:predicted nucleic acid-binding protein